MLDFIYKPINPPPPYKFAVISLFAGAGGSSLGYKWAGGKVLAAVECDKNAVETYQCNHRDTPVLQRDIATVTSQELLLLARLHPGELDILDGSPPCQGFSTSGYRHFDDPRNGLFKEYIRLLRELQPRVFLMENVSGLVQGKMKHIFAMIMRELKASGYRVRCQMMNTAYFGVPQLRERLIFLGVREDLGIPSSYPPPFTAPIPPRIAFQGITDTDAPALPDWQQKAAQEMIAGNYGQVHAAKAYLKYIGSTDGAMSVKLLSWDKCCCTVVKSETGRAYIIHPDKKRRLSIGEMKRICSFPDAFQFVGGRRFAVERMGNAVPPRFMQSIAEHIYAHILINMKEQSYA